MLAPEASRASLDRFHDLGGTRGNDGRTILVRNIWSDITTDSIRFEQWFFNDGNKTWEVNWIAADTRVTDGAG
jgi:hypothetical protein